MLAEVVLAIGTWFPDSGAATLVPLVTDFGIKGIIEEINKKILNGTFDLIELLFSDVVSEMLKLRPSKLHHFQSMYETSTLLFFTFLSLYGLSYLGVFQLFPQNEKTDPYRFMSRAFAALMALLVVNPPGNSSLFSKGVFAWAFTISNKSIDLFLKGVDLSVTLSDDPAAGLAGTVPPSVMAILGALLVLVVVFSQICLFVALIARQVLVYFTYALFPLLIIFWVADAGPLKHAKNLSEKLFKATGMLIPGGVLIAGILAVGVKFTSETISTFSGAGTAAGVDATFSDPVSAVINFLIMPLTIAAVTLLPSMQLMQWLSGAGLGGIPTPSPGQALSKSKNTISNLRRGSISGGIGSVGIGSGDSGGSGGIAGGDIGSVGIGIAAQASDAGQSADSNVQGGDSGSMMDAGAGGGSAPDNVSALDGSENADSDGSKGFNHPGFDDIETDPDKPGYSSENMETGEISTTDEYTMVDARREASAETDGFTSDGFRFYADDPTDEQRELREKRARQHYMEKSEDFSELSITDFTEDEFADLTDDQQSRLQFRKIQSQQEYLESQSDGVVESYIKETGKTSLSGTATTVATAAIADEKLALGIAAILGIGAAAGAIGRTFELGVESQDHRLSAGGIYGGLKNATGKVKNTLSRSDGNDSSSDAEKGSDNRKEY